MSIAILIGLMFSADVIPLRDGWYGLPSAVLWKDQLFAQTGTAALRSSGLYRNCFLPERGQVHAPLEYWGGGGGGIERVAWWQAKMEIRGSRLLWFTAGNRPHILPLTELQYLEESDFGIELCRTRQDETSPHDVARMYSSFFSEFFFPAHRPPDVPLPKLNLSKDSPHADSPLYAEKLQSQAKLLYLRHARFDVQIDGSKSVRLFHAYREELFVSIEPDYLRNWYWDKKTQEVAKSLPKPPDRELRTGKIPKDFTEHFAAYTSGKRDYLVTPSGKVYMAVPKGKAELEVTKVWDDPRRRIVGVVQDQANDAVYGWGFATDSAAVERFYVKMEPRPAAVEYRLTVPLWNDRSDAYLESYECARAFRKAAEKK